MYIYNMPYVERMQLCKILDEQDRWEELATVHMQYDLRTINIIKKSDKPTDYLLTNWGNKNHTVLELFELLYRMKNYEGMVIIKHFVDPIYHSKIVKCARNIINIKKPEVNSMNFNSNVKKPSNLKFLANDGKTTDNNNISPQLQNQSFKYATPSDASIVSISAGSIPQISYANLLEATNHWDNRNLLGKGGFGTVFKGKWKNTQVAIKRIEPRLDAHIQMKQSIVELQCLNAYRHDNILPVYGYSIDGPLPCLIYKYMAGGSLDSRLRVTDPGKALTWPKRLDIALGVARGLQFLHTSGEKGLVHADIKSANILLDLHDMPLIGDFGLAREGPNGDYTKVSKVHGTVAYLPAEFLRHKKFSTKVDVYSFGVVLFELATARKAAVKVGSKIVYLKEAFDYFEGDVMTLKDPLVGGYDSCFKGLIDIGILCVHDNAYLRPEMVEVYKMLEGREVWCPT